MNNWAEFIHIHTYGADTDHRFLVVTERPSAAAVPHLFYVLLYTGLLHLITVVIYIECYTFV